MATIRDKLGHLETLPIDLLNAHLNASFIFNHLDAMNGWSKLLLCNREAQKSWFITCLAWITCGDMARFVTNRCHTLAPQGSCRGSPLFGAKNDGLSQKLRNSGRCAVCTICALLEKRDQAAGNDLSRRWREEAALFFA
jgi:hypothetical protein